MSHSTNRVGRRKGRQVRYSHAVPQERYGSSEFERERSAWANSAEHLAKWAGKHFINRNDRVIHYLAERDRSRKQKAVAENRPVEFNNLVAHFECKRREHILIAHAISPDNTCLWGAIDIDNHGEYDAEIARRNLIAAERMAEQFRRAGITTLVLDSNGRGGFHVIAMFAQPVPASDVFYMLSWLAEDFDFFGLEQRPETFPKQDGLSKKKPFGNGLRLPGLHHTWNFLTRVRVDDTWLTGIDAIRHLLQIKPASFTGVPGSFLPAGASDHAAEKRCTPNSRNVSLPQNRCDDQLRPMDRVISRLGDLGKCPRQAGTGGFVAFCPAHADVNSPSLSVTEAADGVVLVYCFARDCSASSIAAAIGLDVADFFPKRGCRRRHTRDLARFRLERTLEVPDPRLGLLAREFEGCGFNRLQQLADQWGVGVESLQRLGVGWCHDETAWTLPERNHSNEVVGIQYRNADGCRWMHRDAKRGLIIPEGWDSGGDRLLLPEGHSDVAALISNGHSAIGRPSCKYGAEFLGQILKHERREIIVVGENDEKEDGSWPGRDGAHLLANTLKRELKRPVKAWLPPPDYKDVRQLIQDGGLS